MVDPITAVMAAGIGVNAVQNLAQTATNTVSAINASGATNSASFQDVQKKMAKMAFKELFKQHPEIQEQVGAGPYTLTSNADNTMTLTSQATGNSMLLDGTTKLGVQSMSLANSVNLKGMPNGMTFSTL